MAVGIQPRLTIDRLMRMSRAELEKLYSASDAGPIPDGDSTGRATVPSTRGSSKAWEAFFSIFWSGKVFDRESKDPGRATLLNKTLLGRRFGAAVYYAESMLDGKRSIIIDYKDNITPIIKNVRDEIRRVDRDLYLGFAYIRYPGKTQYRQALAFALDFAKTTIEEKVELPRAEPLPQTP